MNEKLWSNIARERLQAAEPLCAREPDAELKNIQNKLLKPNGEWPFGWATTINPLVMTLGASPGTSSRSKNQDSLEFEEPPAGRPHDHVSCRLNEGGEYWKRVTYLAEIFLQKAGITDKQDIFSLFGNVNLDNKSSGQAKKVEAKADFVNKLLINIRENFRPRIVICVGLKGYFKNKKNKHVKKEFQDVFGLDMTIPDCIYPFTKYTKSNLQFRQWKDFECADGSKIKFVLWPQHPRRRPMTDFEIWKDSCEEFIAENPGLIT